MPLHRRVNTGFLRKRKVSARYSRPLPPSKQGAEHNYIRTPSARELWSRASRQQGGHLYAIEPVPTSRRLEKRGETPRQSLAKRQDKALDETREIYEKIAGILTSEDLQLLQGAGAAEGAALSGRA